MPTWTSNIPSQVKTYANTGAFPVTGSVKTIYIAEDTNIAYYWTGSGYQAISIQDLSGLFPNPTGTTSQYLRGDGSLATFPAIPDVSGLQLKPVVVNANITAQNDTVYHVVANATFTDPTGVEGRGYVVLVRDGSATIGGNTGGAGTINYRIFRSGTWTTYQFWNINQLINVFVPQTRTINGLDLSANRTLTTANINDSANRRYVTDAQLTVIGNTSGTNTGDQVAILSGILFINTNTGGTDRFISPYSDTAAVSEFSRQIAVPKMTLNHFYVVLAVTQPATGSHVLTVRKNGVDTGLVITIPAGSSSGVFSATASVSFDIGDLLSIKCVNNASTSAGQINAISLFA